MGDEADELLKHRFAIINLWRPIRGPVLESPMTVCDAQSLAEEDLIASDLRYPRSCRRDLFDHLQPQPALLLFPQDAAGQTRTDPLLRLGAEGSGAVLRPHRLRRPDLAARRAAAREPRSPLPAAGLTEFVAPAKAEGQSRCLRIAALGS